MYIVKLLSLPVLSIWPNLVFISQSHHMVSANLRHPQMHHMYFFISWCVIKTDQENPLFFSSDMMFLFVFSCWPYLAGNCFILCQDMVISSILSGYMEKKKHLLMMFNAQYKSTISTINSIWLYCLVLYYKYIILNTVIYNKKLIGLNSFDNLFNLYLIMQT